MTLFTASPATGSPATRPVGSSRRARAAGIGLWAVRILLSTPFLMGGLLKVTADPRMVAMFEDIGAGQGLRLLVGACELAGAAGLLIPRLARPAASGIVLLMVGAAVTNIVVLHISPALPLVLLVLAVTVAITPTRKGNGR